MKKKEPEKAIHNRYFLINAQGTAKRGKQIAKKVLLVKKTVQGCLPKSIEIIGTTVFFSVQDEEILKDIMSVVKAIHSLKVHESSRDYYEKIKGQSAA